MIIPQAGGHYGQLSYEDVNISEAEGRGDILIFNNICVTRVYFCQHQ